MIQHHVPRNYIGSGRGGSIVRLLEARDGKLTIVELKTGQICRTFNVAAGRDTGADWEHITTNISPTVSGEPGDFFHTSEVTKIVDPETGEAIWPRHNPSILS